MSARAMWKGVIAFGGIRVPVKFYAAIADQDVHFRLLHAKDRVPVKQAMVNPDTDAVVDYADAKRAYVTADHDWVQLEADDLEAIEPEASREIEIVHFVPPKTIDHRWYLRPYYLGPDGDDETHAALIAALSESGYEGLARWTMRNKAHVGALRVHARFPVLVTLRHAGEVIDIDELSAPEGPALDQRELDMARQLIGMLEDDFKPEDYENHHRERVLDLIETKRRGESIDIKPKKQRKPSKDVAGALKASLKQQKRSA